MAQKQPMQMATAMAMAIHQVSVPVRMQWQRNEGGRQKALRHPSWTGSTATTTTTMQPQPPHQPQPQPSGTLTRGTAVRCFTSRTAICTGTGTDMGMAYPSPRLSITLQRQLLPVPVRRQGFLLTALWQIRIGWATGIATIVAATTTTPRRVRGTWAIAAMPRA